MAGSLICGDNAHLTCRYFDISAQIFCRWLHRYSAGDLTALGEPFRRPRRFRQPSWSAALEQAVLKPRREYPRWGKDKLAVSLCAKGCAVSVLMSRAHPDSAQTPAALARQSAHRVSRDQSQCQIGAKSVPK